MAVGPVTALVEGGFFGTHQHAILVDAHAHQVAAEREVAGIYLVDAGLQVVGLQQALAVEHVHARIAGEQDRQWRGLHGSIAVHVSLGGAHAGTVEAVQRQHAETEGAALWAGQVAAVHAPGLQVVLLAQVMAVIDVVEFEMRIATAAAVALLGEVPVSGHMAPLEQAQNAGAARTERLVVAPTGKVEYLLVQESVLGIAAERVEALRGGLATDPLARHEQAHGALAFVIQRARGRRVLRGIQIAATGLGATEAAGQVAVAWQRLRQCRQQRGLRLGGQVQCLQHARGIFQLHMLQGDAHRRQPGRAAEQLDVELFGLSFDQIFETGRDAARGRQRSGQRQGERDRQPGDGGGV